MRRLCGIKSQGEMVLITVINSVITRAGEARADGASRFNLIVSLRMTAERASIREKAKPFELLESNVLRPSLIACGVRSDISLKIYPIKYTTGM
jgi:hypothetical protein